MNPSLEATEDLREFYITPVYLKQMNDRAQNWSLEAIENQIQLFKQTIPDYPEVCELLEAELHRRKLNQLLRYIRSNRKLNLQQLLKKYKHIPDYAEMIQIEIEIRMGADVLNDRSDVPVAKLLH